MAGLDVVFFFLVVVSRIEEDEYFWAFYWTIPLSASEEIIFITAFGVSFGRTKGACKKNLISSRPVCFLLDFFYHGAMGRENARVWIKGWFRMNV